MTEDEQIFLEDDDIQSAMRDGISSDMMLFLGNAFAHIATGEELDELFADMYPIDSPASAPEMSSMPLEQQILYYENPDETKSYDIDTYAEGPEYRINYADEANNRADISVYDIKYEPHIPANEGIETPLYDVTRPEFMHNGQNVLADKNLQPWYCDKDTGEIKSWFKFNGGQLYYRNQYNRMYLLQSEDFQIPHLCDYGWGLTYGRKIKENGVWRFECEPTKKFHINNISSDNGTFLDIVSYPAAYNKDYAKHILLKNTIRKILADIVSEACKCKPDDIHLPYKMISCVFRSNYDKIKKALDAKPKIVYTKQGKPAKKQPDPPASTADVMKAVGTFSHMMNGGDKPGLEFYVCDGCQSESVCMYKEIMIEWHNRPPVAPPPKPRAHKAKPVDKNMRMLNFNQVIQSPEEIRLSKEYAAAHKGQLPLLFPEMLR